MRPARIAALGVATLVAAVAAWAFLRSPSGSGPSGAVGTAAAPVEGTWDPNGGARKPGSRGAGTAGAKAEPPPQALPSALPDTGTPVKEGQSVSVTMPWGAGKPSSFRYEIVDLNLVKYEATGYVDALETTWRVVLSVVQGDGTGATTSRLRLVVESMRVRAFGPAGLPIDVDSRSYDPDSLDPAIQRLVVPSFAILRHPVEFHTDGAGAVTDVDGAEDWRERYLAEVQRLEKRAVNDAPDAWTRDSVVQTWSEFLFPRLGGGTLVGGASRPWNRDQRLGGGWELVWTGKVEATRDDPDAFRAEITGTPQAENRGGTPTNEADAQIAKMYAHGSERAYVAAYRFGRSPGALIEAQIDHDFRFVSSRKTGGAPGAPTFTPEWTQRKRRALVRRTSE